MKQPYRFRISVNGNASAHTTISANNQPEAHKIADQQLQPWEDVSPLHGPVASSGAFYVRYRQTRAGHYTAWDEFDPAD